MSHPIHPLIVHFPIACWSLVTIGDGLMFFGWALSFAPLINGMLLMGCIFALVAMLAGLYELLRLHIMEDVQQVVDCHMYAAVVTLCFYSISLFIRWNGGVPMPSVWALLGSFLGFVSLIVTGWYGGRLVYQYGVGLDKHSS
jgi:uncharacterized membrane protein